MKKKLLVCVLVIAMLTSMLVPIFSVSAAAPTVKLEMSQPEFISDEYGEALKITVKATENSADIYAMRFLLFCVEGTVEPDTVIMSDKNDTETLRVIVTGRGGGTYTLGGTFSENLTGEIPAEIAATIPSTAKGFRLLLDSDNDKIGITGTGNVCEVYFLAPTNPGKYTFRLVWVDGSPLDTTYKHEATMGEDVTYVVKCADNAHTGGTATCKALAKCTVCGSEYGEKAQHSYTVPQKDTTHHWNKCATCEDTTTKVAHTDANGTYETDGTHHWHTCSCDTVFDKAAHTGGAATCTEKAKCEVCGAEHGSKLDHTHNIVNKDSTHHWNECSCGDIDDSSKTAHVYDQQVKTTEYVYSPVSCKDDGVYYYSCVCGAKGTTTFVDVGSATGDHRDADGDYETDGTHHWHTCSCGTEFDKDTHTGGVATCTQKAECSTCGAEYGEKEEHIHTVPQVDATHHWSKCKFCEDTTPKVAHSDPDGEWETNGTHHWHTCSCGAEFDKVTHTGGTASCTQKAQCTACGVEYGDKAQHSHTVLQKDATHHWYKCANCEDTTTKIAHTDADGDYETDGTNHWHTCSCGTEFDKDGHTGGTATCTTQKVCTTCGTSYGSTLDHSYTVPQNDATHHWNKCATCEDTTTKIAHTDANGAYETNGTHHWHTCSCGAEFDKNTHTGGTASCTQKAKCTTCATEYGEKAQHSHTVPQKDATHHWNKCANCEDTTTKVAHTDANGQYETNGTHHWHTCSCGTEFDKAAHTGGTATCTEKAKCEACGAEHGSKLDHTYNVANYDATHHWNECSCGEVDTATKIAHTFDKEIENDNTLKDAATCAKNAVYYKSCSCGAVSTTATFEKANSATGNHDYDGGTVKVTKEASLTEKGEIEITCNNCTNFKKVDTDKLTTELKTDNITVKSEQGVPADLTKTADTTVVKGLGNNEKALDAFGFTAISTAPLSGKTAELTIDISDFDGKYNNLKVAVLKADGTTETVNATIQDGKAVFTADLGASYVVIGTKVDTVTGDFFAIAIYIVLAVAAAGALAIVAKKRFAL